MAIEAARRVVEETGEVVEAGQPAGPSAFGVVRIPARFVINQQGKDYVLSDGLIEGLHQLSGGFFEVDTRLEQLPNEANGMLAVCAAKVTVFDPEQPDVVRRSATGIGDASAASVNRMIGPHLIRMAETRALNRALRVLLNVGTVSYEELGPTGPDDGPPRVAAGVSAAAPATGAPAGDRIKIGERVYDRVQVVATYRRRLQQMHEASLVIPPGDLVAEDAALPLLVGASQSFKKRLDALQGRDGPGK